MLRNEEQKPNKGCMNEENLNSFEWYFGAQTRKQAEESLRTYGKNEGTFLVRKGVPATEHPYRISILDWKDNKCVFYHYKLQKTGRGFYYIDPYRTFSTISELINWYLSNSSELPVRLSFPCRKQRTLLSYKNLTHHELSKLPQIKRSMVTMERKLWKNKSRNVELWKGSLRSREGPIAIKLQTSSENESQENLLEEAKILHELKHNNILSLIGVIKLPPFAILSEFQDNGDLLSFLLQEVDYEHANVLSIRMAQEVARALHYVSSMKYVHRNVRACNVLLDRELTCKLAGFSYAAPLDENNKYFSAEDDLPFDNTTKRWMALEAACEKRFSASSDVWSFSILLYEIFTKGEMPYAEVLAPYVIDRVRAGFRLKRKRCIPEDVYAIMTTCWQEDEATRPSFSDIIISLDEMIYKQTNAGPKNMYLSPLQSKSNLRYVRF